MAANSWCMAPISTQVEYEVKEAYTGVRNRWRAL